MNFSLFAQTSQAGTSQTFIMIGIAAVFFWWMIYRPEQKRRKEQEDMRNNLKVGDEVVAMAIFGIVDKIEEQTLILKMVDGSKIKVMKASISEIIAQS
jgi:preprotein translocase subunit YajC